VVLASPITTSTDGTVAKAPNRGEVHLALACDGVATVAAVQAASWQDALGSRRMLERHPLAASAGTDRAGHCGRAQG
jgi:hypothetical protein